MRQEVVNIYRFEELEGTARDKAREWYRSDMSIDYEFENDYLIEWFANQLEEMGYWVPDHTNKSWWIMWDDYQNVSLKKVDIDDLDKIAKWLLDEKAYRRFKMIKAVADFEYEVSSDAYVDMVGHLRCDYPKVADVLEELERAISDDISNVEYRFKNQIRESYEYIESDEHIDGSIIANEYEFTENGRRWA